MPKILIEIDTDTQVVVPIAKLRKWSANCLSSHGYRTSGGEMAAICDGAPVMDDCELCGGFGDVSGEYPGVQCPRCHGVGMVEIIAPQPEQAQQSASFPCAILPEEMEAFARFCECCEYDDSYDVPKDMMNRLAEIGLVRSLSRGAYQTTEFGISVAAQQPAPRQVFSKEWCMKMAELEGDANISIGFPPAPRPIQTSERLPTEADADCFGNVWARLAVADRYDLYPLRFVMSCPEAFDYWQPTGLTRPAEPGGE